MNFYRVFMHCLASPCPLWHATSAADCGANSPDIQLDLAPTEAEAHEWEPLPWSVIREQAGADWHLSLAVAPPGSEAALRLSTRRQDDRLTVIFGSNAERIVGRWQRHRQDDEQFRRELSAWMLGSVLGYAMCLRGLPTLHGSVVEINGQAVGLLGGSGQGKSTLAAALLTAGCAMLADDQLVVRRANERQEQDKWYALPGPPRLRLWPSSFGVLDRQAPLISTWADDEGKQHIEPTIEAYCAEPRPLAAIYVLMPREYARREAATEELSPAAALNALMKQRFCTAPLNSTYTAASLTALSELAQQTRVRLLYRPEGLESLASVVAAVQGNLDHDDQ